MAEIDELLAQLPLLREWQQWSSAKHGQQRSFVIEFAGMPKAGKSSAIENLRHFFSHGHKDNRSPEYNMVPRRSGYQVYTPAEGVSLRTPSELTRDKVDFNTWAGAYALQELLRAYHDTRNDLVILDRGPWDAGCWLEYWKDQAPHWDSADVAKVADFFHFHSWVTRSDLHVLLVVDPEESRKRERDSRLVEHGGFSSNAAGMAAMKSIYENKFPKLLEMKASECPHVRDLAAIKIDTTGIDPKAVAQLIVERALAVIEAKVSHYKLQFEFSPDWIEANAKGYMPAARGNKEFLQAFFTELARKGNALPPAKRLKFKERIEEASAPEGLIALRAPKSGEKSDIQESLEAIFREVEDE